MKALALLVAALVSAPFAWATAQYPDKLVIDGATHSLHSNPLEDYFARHPDRLARTNAQSSALWRGYVATFEIIDRVLRVRDVQIEEWDKTSKNHETRWVSILATAFPAGTARTLDGFTGFLILPQGKVKEYVHMGYASTFERCRLLFVRAGRVTGDRVFTADEYRDYKTKQFETFTRTQRYRDMRAKLRNGESGVSADHFLYIFDATFPVETLIGYKDFRPNQPSP